MLTHRRNRFRGLAAGLGIAVVTTGLASPVISLSATAATPPVVSPAPAAVEVSTTATNFRGGTVTFSTDHVVPGGTIRVTGTGFTADAGGGAEGTPVLAAKVNGSEYEAGAFPWGFSGPSALTPADMAQSAGSEGFAPIGVAADGSFDVTFTVPASWTPRGEHNLTFLGGSLSTGSKVLPVQSFSGRFGVVSATQGWATVSSVAHAQDSVNTAKVQVRLRNFRAGADGLGAGQKVGVKIDGAGDIVQCLETNAEGDTNVAVALPGKDVVNLTAGAHELWLLAGTECVSGGPATQGPGKNVRAGFKVAKSTVISTAHHPGGEVEVALEGFTNELGNAGQKVALKITGEGYQQPTFACLTTDGFGNGTGRAPIPAELAPGAYTVNALAGSNCGEPGNGAPGRSLQAAFTVTEKPVDFVATSAAAVTGTARVNQTLRASVPTWSTPAASQRFEWLRNGQAIARATGITYTATPADLGKRLQVRISATSNTGATTVSTSPTTVAVAAATFAVKKKVSIKGTAKVGKKLRATKATLSTSGVKTKYQWLRNGKAIKKASKSTYKVTRTDRAKKVSLKVTFTKAGHRTVTQKTKALRVR